MTPETLALRMTRLAAGISQSDMTEDGATVTVWPRDTRTGRHEVTVHPQGGRRKLLHEIADIEEALLAGERESLRSWPGVSGDTPDAPAAVIGYPPLAACRAPAVAGLSVDMTIGTDRVTMTTSTGDRIDYVHDESGGRMKMNVSGQEGAWSEEPKSLLLPKALHDLWTTIAPAVDACLANHGTREELLAFVRSSGFPDEDADTIVPWLMGTGLVGIALNVWRHSGQDEAMIASFLEIVMKMKMKVTGSDATRAGRAGQGN